MVAKSIAKIYTNIHKPTDYERDKHDRNTFSYFLVWCVCYKLSGRRYVISVEVRTNSVCLCVCGLGLILSSTEPEACVTIVST